MSSAASNEGRPLLLEDEDDIDEATMTIKNMRQEVSTLFSLAWPVVITNILNYSITSVSVFSLGHIDTSALAAISLASLLYSTTGLCVAQGLASALDTLCSQSFTGSTDYYAVGKHLQRAMVVSFCLCIPISVIWLFAEQILLSFGQDKKIARISGVFISWMIPGIFPVFINEALKRYLQAQGIMKPSMYLTALSAVIAVFLQWLLVWSDTPFNLGVIGAPISTSIVNIFTPLATIAYMYFIEGGERFGEWSWKEALDVKKLKDIIALGIPGTFMVISEWLCFEAAALAAGILGTESLAAQTIVINSGSLLWQIPFGLATATTTRIGNSLGAQLPNTAKRVAYTALLFSLVPAFLNMGLLLVFKDTWGYIFSKEDSVVRLVASILPLAAFYQLSDTTGSIGGGAIRGCGLQKWGSYINLFGYYVLGVPIGLLLTFHPSFNMGLYGIWVGLTVGLIFVSTAQLGVILTLDWGKMAQDAKSRLFQYEEVLEA